MGLWKLLMQRRRLLLGQTAMQRHQAAQTALQMGVSLGLPEAFQSASTSAMGGWEKRCYLGAGAAPEEQTGMREPGRVRAAGRPSSSSSNKGRGSKGPAKLCMLGMMQPQQQMDLCRRKSIPRQQVRTYHARSRHVWLRLWCMLHSNAAGQLQCKGLPMCRRPEGQQAGPR